MKKKFLKVALLLLSLVACQRDQEPVLFQPYSGTYIQAKLNGVDWHSQFERSGWVMDAQAPKGPATALECSDGFYWVLLRQVNRAGSLRTEIGVQTYQFSPKRYSLSPRNPSGTGNACIPFALFSTLEGDVGTGSFDLKPDADNYLTIEKFDPEQRFIEGTFQMTFAPTSIGKYSIFTATDTLRFTEGRFRARIRQKGDPDWGK